MTSSRLSMLKTGGAIALAFGLAVAFGGCSNDGSGAVGGGGGTQPPAEGTQAAGSTTAP